MSNLVFNGDFSNLPVAPLVDTTVGLRYINGKAGGSFSDTYGWFFDDRNLHASSAGFIEGPGYHGGGAVRLKNLTVDGKCSVNSRKFDAKSNTVYELSASVDLENVPEGGVFIRANLYPAGSNTANMGFSTETVSGNAHCRQLKLTFTTISSTAKIALELQNRTTGAVSTATFYNVEVKEKADLVPAPTNTAITYGVNSPFDPLTTWANEDLVKYCDKMKELGAQWLRVSFVGSHIHPTGGSAYNYTVYDRMTNIVNSRGLKVIPILSYDTSTIDTDEFTDYFTEIVTHFKDFGIQYYELWNEKNLFGTYNQNNSPEWYAHILERAYPAIKAGDPRAKVLFSGITGGTVGQTVANSSTMPEYSPSDFLAVVYAAGAGNYFDVMNYHPYGHTHAVAQELRRVMADNGDALKPMVFTEDGIPTGGKTGQMKTDEAGQAQYMVDAVDFAKAYGAAMLIIYNGNDSLGNRPDREGYFGVTTGPLSTLVEKPAFQALKTKIAS